MLQSSEIVVASKKELFQAAISSPDLDKNKQKNFFELFNMYIMM